MRSAYLRLLAVSAISIPLVAEAQLVANLPLTCSSESAIGQTNCDGEWAYSVPNTDQLIVLRSNGTWERAATLASADTLTVCALPVQPGIYSNCRDSAGVRRLVQLPKSQVFPSEPPLPPSTGARILDLSLPVIIDEPGLYVLDRDWYNDGVSVPGEAWITVRSGAVTLDLQGFRLNTMGTAIMATRGGNFTLRNGRIEVVDSEGAIAVSVSSPWALIENVFVGARVEITSGSTIRNSEIRDGVFAGGRNTIVDNTFSCTLDDGWCIEIDSHGRDAGGTFVSRNRIWSNGNGINIGRYETETFVLDNVFTSGCGLRGTAVLVGGHFNLIRNNIMAGCQGRAGWLQGIEFQQDGNAYGLNTVWATTPFNVGATIQTDLGGNVGLSN